MSTILHAQNGGELHVDNAEWLAVELTLGLFLPGRRGWAYFRNSDRLDDDQAQAFADDLEAAAAKLEACPGHGVPPLRPLPDVARLVDFARTSGGFTLKTSRGFHGVVAAPSWGAAPRT
jgi:hypothetical protein